MKKGYYSIPEYAKLLGLSRIAIYQRVRKGHLKAIRVGRNYMIPIKYAGLDKTVIDQVIKKTVKEYGEVLKKLGRE